MFSLLNDICDKSFTAKLIISYFRISPLSFLNDITCYFQEKVVHLYWYEREKSANDVTKEGKED